MGYHDFAVGEVLTDAHMDEIVRQTRIICTSSTRPSSPITGMHIYETDTTFTREWNGAAWRTFPKGIIDRATGDDVGLGGFIVGTEVTVGGSDCSFTSYETAQQYKYSWRFAVHVGVDLTVFDVVTNLNGSHIGVPYPANVVSAGVGRGLLVSGHINFVAAVGSHIVDTTIVRTFGSGGGQIFAGGDFVLEHLGTL